MTKKCPVCERWGYDMNYVHELDMCYECAEKAGYELMENETNVFVRSLRINFIKGA